MANKTPASRHVKTVVIEDDSPTFESNHVHLIYDEIAGHFSSTRYKPWPIIAKFLNTLPTGWVGLDSGTGNGKYLPLPLDRPGDIMTIGLDRSYNLLRIAKNAGGCREVILGDVLDQVWRIGIFDYAISIATIHHLASHERRRRAVQRLLQSVSPSHGRVLIYVWAVEQDELSKRQIPMDDEAAGQLGKDVMVPWVLSSNHATVDLGADAQTRVLDRYYHMFAQGELVALVTEAAEEIKLRIGPKPESTVQQLHGVEIVKDGWERSNYYVELHLWNTHYD